MDLNGTREMAWVPIIKMEMNEVVPTETKSSESSGVDEMVLTYVRTVAANIVDRVTFSFVRVCAQQLSCQGGKKLHQI